MKKARKDNVIGYGFTFAGDKLADVIDTVYTDEFGRLDLCESAKVARAQARQYKQVCDNDSRRVRIFRVTTKNGSGLDITARYLK